MASTGSASSSSASAPAPPVPTTTPSSSTAGTGSAAGGSLVSKVLYFDKLPSEWTEEKIRSLLSSYGEPRKIVLLRKRNALFAGHNPVTLETIKNTTIQALVEMDDVQTASQIVEALDANPLSIDGRELAVSFSKNQELRDRTLSHRQRNPKEETTKTNRILLVTVQNPTYPITTDLMYEIFNAYGTVEKIVLFVKPIGLQCLIQFATLEEAIEAKNALSGLSIFPDCCALVINFSNLPQELIVKENGLRTKDFINADLPIPEHDVPVNPCGDISGHLSNMMPYPTHGMMGAPTGHDPMGYPHPGHPGPPGPPAPVAPNMQPGPGMMPTREVVSPVLLVCNLRESVTCDQIFNLFSCYGNIARIKKLNNKPDHALIQFSTPLAAQSALVHLRGFMLFGRSLEISYSKHSYITIRPGGPPNAAAEAETGGDSIWMKEYGHGLNRFTGKYANSTKHIYSPTRILHFSNFDEKTTQDELKNHLMNFHGAEHAKIKFFTSPTGHTQALAEFPSVDAATNVLASAHNSLFEGKRLKVAFSKHSLHV